MASFVDGTGSNASSDDTKLSDDSIGTEVGAVKSLQELAAKSVAALAANQIQKSESKEDIDKTRGAVESIQASLAISKNTLGLVFVLDNTASQKSSWELIRNTLKNLIPFLESRHGNEDQFKISYEIRIIYANDYTEIHSREASAARRTNQKYVTDPRFESEGRKAVVGELCRISSSSSDQQKKDFIETISRMNCYGGGDRAEAYAPALELALENIGELKAKYGDNAVIACIFCGDDVPHGCSSQDGSFRDSWAEGDPSGKDWFEVINRFGYPIHGLSPPHADEDSRCAIGYAVKKTGGFHLTVNQSSSRVLLRLLMAEMKLSWLVERNLKDMESATPEEISAKIAELVNKESFEQPNNTVPVDPRIEEIDKEIAKSGFSSTLMRSATASVPRKRINRDRQSVSTLSRGVSGPGMMRALRTATGGSMRPEMMRAVSDSVARETAISEEEDDFETVSVLAPGILGDHGLGPPPMVRSREVYDEDD